MTNITSENDDSKRAPRCHVGLSIIGTALDLDAISVALSTRSAATVRTGDQRALGPALQDTWTLSSPIESVKPLEEHLHWLRQQLEPHVNYLRQLSRVAQIRVHVGLTLFRDQNGFAITTESVNLFSSIGAFIQLYILCDFDDDRPRQQARPVAHP
jgi:hypothetical protein